MKKIILLSLMLLVLVPVVQAQPDAWYIDNAVDGVVDLYPEVEKYRESIQGSVISGYHWHGVGQHKHVELTASFGYQDSGSLYWEGRVYTNTELGHEAGDVFEWNEEVYSYTKPESAKIRWTYKYLKNCGEYNWDDTSWVPNPRISINLRDNEPDGKHSITVFAMGLDGFVLRRDVLVRKSQHGITVVFPPEYHGYLLGYLIN